MAPDDVYEFGEYRLDAGRRLLSHCATGPIPVTSRVFDTLLHLVRQSGQLVGKRELMNAVWGNTVVEENNLTQAVSTLRQLLGEPPGEHRYIVTVPGRGYRFVADVARAAGVGEGDAPAPSPKVPGLHGPQAAPVRAARRWPLFAGIAAAALATLAAALWWRQDRLDSQPAIETIAVLPFKPLVPDARDPALELGMADNLIARLSAGGGIVVRPLGSVRKYTEVEQDPLAAGRELGVDAVLDGSIHRDGDAVRVTTRLMRVRDGAALWVDKLDQPWTDLFSVQDGIAERAAAALALRLTSDERARLMRRYTENEAAYRLYLLGRYHWLKLVPPEIDRSIEYFDQAIEEDPGYALAHAGLAEAYRALAITSDRRPREVLPVGKAAALRALELDDRLDSAWASLCFIQIWSDWDWPSAERSCKRALGINPNGADGHRAYAILLSNLARHDAAITHARRASELDPLSLITTSIEGHVLHYAGRDDEALRRLSATLELDPNFWIARLFVGKVHLGRGRLEEAMRELELARRFSAGNSETISLIGYALARAGDREGASRAIAELRAREAERYVPPFNVAMIYNGLRDDERTLDWLEKAYEDRDVRLTFLKVERKWDPLRADRRFESLAARLKLD
jgi:serine/threonine-protein kinase